jgi:D-glycero-alpha-D-manno-heptose 1-phosphate guanylyltransferase
MDWHMDAIVLCGGKGTRLSSVISDVPKPLAPVNGRPFLDYLLSYLAASGLVRHAILATGHLAEKVEQHYESRFGPLRLSYSREDNPLGTGGAVLLALRRHAIASPFFIANGDSFVDASLASLSALLSEKADLAMSLYQIDDAARFGSVELEGRTVTGFHEKNGRPVPGTINAGLYACRPHVFDAWHGHAGALSLEQDMLPILVQQQRVAGLCSGTRFIDIGLPETYLAAPDFFN